jgi:hypothetical protein
LRVVPQSSNNLKLFYFKLHLYVANIGFSPDLIMHQAIYIYTILNITKLIFKFAPCYYWNLYWFFFLLLLRFFTLQRKYNLVVSFMDLIKYALMLFKFILLSFIPKKITTYNYLNDYAYTGSWTQNLWLKRPLHYRCVMYATRAERLELSSQVLKTYALPLNYAPL